MEHKQFCSLDMLVTFLCCLAQQLKAMGRGTDEKEGGEMNFKIYFKQ